jgi:hypothetical protein
MIYVCDRCGYLHSEDAVTEGERWTCLRCDSHTAWEFPPNCASAAREHSAHIIAGLKLFQVAK